MEQDIKDRIVYLFRIKNNLQDNYYELFDQKVKEELRGIPNKKYYDDLCNNINNILAKINDIKIDIDNLSKKINGKPNKANFCSNLFE
jgi:vacuolar-type H+-ATPase subunit E/Vma4